MSAPRYDSRSWTGELTVSAPPPLPPSRYARPLGPSLLTPVQDWAGGHASLLMISPIGLVAAYWIVLLMTSDLLVDSPGLVPIASVVLLVGAGLKLASETNFMPRLWGVIALVGWL